MIIEQNPNDSININMSLFEYSLIKHMILTLPKKALKLEFPEIFVIRAELMSFKHSEE